MGTFWWHHITVCYADYVQHAMAKNYLSRRFALLEESYGSVVSLKRRSSSSKKARQESCRSLRRTHLKKLIKSVETTRTLKGDCPHASLALQSVRLFPWLPKWLGIQYKLIRVPRWSNSTIVTQLIHCYGCPQQWKRCYL